MVGVERWILLALLCVYVCYCLVSVLSHNQELLAQLPRITEIAMAALLGWMIPHPSEQPR